MALNTRIFPLVAFALVAVGCTSHPSPQQTMVDDRHMIYTQMYKAYKEAEDKYLNLLFSKSFITLQLINDHV